MTTEPYITKPATIGYLAKRELTRLVEENPKLTLRILDKAAISLSTNHYRIDEYDRDKAGLAIEDNISGKERYLYFNLLSAIVLMIMPAGPVSISDAEIWIEKDSIPESSLAKIITQATGSKLSDYVSFGDFDIDEVYPGGITKTIDEPDNDKIVLNFARVLFPYDEFAKELRARAEALIAKRKAKAA